MKNQFTAVFILLFTVCLVIASFMCLAPVFTSLTTTFVFLCQVISLKILYEVFYGFVQLIQKVIQEDKSDNKKRKKSTCKKDS